MTESLLPPTPAAAGDRPSLLTGSDLPETPEGYAICCDHGFFEPDPELNARLHQAGFTRAQAQLVYDLAAERLVPLIREIAAEFEAERELRRLVEHFGGEAAWRETSRQILAWARRHLPPTAVEALSTTADGVLALHRMMTTGEPATLPPGASGDTGGDLHVMMRDPRYWRDRDPAFIAKVSEAFRRLYPDRD